MVRQNLVRAVAPAFRVSSASSSSSTAALVPHRAISATARRMGEGDTGGVRSGGSASSDAFSKREKANEDLYTKNKEKEKLLALREKLRVQEKHLKDLGDHIDELSKEAGGEKN